MAERHSAEGTPIETLSYGPLHEIVRILGADTEKRFGVSHVPGTRRVSIGFAAAFASEEGARTAHHALRQCGYGSRLGKADRGGYLVNGQREFAIAEVRDLARSVEDFRNAISEIDASLARDRDEGFAPERLGDGREVGALHDVYEILRDRRLRIDNRFQLSPEGDVAYITMYGTFDSPEMARRIATELDGPVRFTDSRGSAMRIYGAFDVVEIRALADRDVRFYVLAVEMQQQIAANREAQESEREHKEAIGYDKARWPSMPDGGATPEKKSAGRLHDVLVQLNHGLGFHVDGSAHSVGSGASASLLFGAMFSTSFEADRVRKALEQAGCTVSAGSDSRTVIASGSFEVAEIRDLADRRTTFAKLLRELEEMAKESRS